MSILLSDEELRTIGLCIIAQSREGFVTGEGITQMQRDTARCAVIHTLKYLIENGSTYIAREGLKNILKELEERK
jgi:hypothetical protein